MQVAKIFGFLWIATFFSSGLAKAQAGGGFLSFDQFFQNYYLFNPASSDSSEKFTIRLGNSSLYGLFQGVNRLYFDADLKPGKKAAISYSRIGVFVQSSNDGPFINRTRYYGRYSRTLKIKDAQYISLGIALGAVSISLKGSQATAGGTSTAFDGYSGLWYHRKKLKIGISVEQFAQSVITPIQQSFKLKPILNLNAIYYFYISPRCLLSNHLYFRKETGIAGTFDYAPVLLLAKVIEAGANFKFRRGIAIMFGLRTHTIGFGKISFMGSFLIGTRQLSSSADNKFEITARYFM